MTTTITVSHIGPGFGQGAMVAHLQIDRADRDNRLGLAEIEALAGAVAGLRRDPPRLVVLAGAGGRFPPGLDPREAHLALTSGKGSEWARRMSDGIGAVVTGLLALPCPVIAQVGGQAAGAALGLVLAADLVVMDANASVSPLEPGLGPVPCGWSTLMAGRIGTSRAAGWMARNAPLSGAEAVGWGLADALAAPDRPAGAIAEDWAAHILATDPEHPAALRRLLRDEGFHIRLTEGLAAERRVLLETMARPQTEGQLAEAAARLSS